MGTSVYFNNSNATREQELINDLVGESIKNHGIDVYYMPRASRTEVDELYGEDTAPKFEEAYSLEMYLTSANSFEGQQEFFSKFGLEVQEQLRLAVARTTFNRYVRTQDVLRPREGDWVYVPHFRSLFEIRFIEDEVNFFQLGTKRNNPFFYEIVMEKVKLNGELINTGVDDIDAIGNQYQIAHALSVNAGGAGTYIVGEVVYQGPNFGAATAAAYVASWDRPSLELKLRNSKGTFLANVSIVGTQSGASYTLSAANLQEETLDDINNQIDVNFQLVQSANGLIDFTERNPFGEPEELA